MSVSIIMPVKNESKYINTSILSVLRQINSNDKLLIYNDCSEDDTSNKIIKFNDKRITLINGSGKSVGVANALNILLDEVHTTYVARLDGDDIFFPRHLKKAFNFLKKNDIDLCGARMISFPKIKIKYNPSDYSSILKSLKSFNPIFHPTIFSKSVVFKRYKYSNLKLVEDYDLWIRMLLDGVRILNSNHFATFYRVSKLQETKNPLVDLYRNIIYERYSHSIDQLLRKKFGQ